MPTFHLLSDLHLELGGAPILPKNPADYLFLAGDIGNPFDPHYEVLLRSCAHYKAVFLVPGNHEYYQGKAESEVLAQLQRIAPPNVHILQKQVCQLDDGTVVLGCTLWSHIRQAQLVQMCLNDFSKIQFLANVSAYNALHAEHVKWIEEQLELHKDKRLILLTHHMPSLQLIAAQYQGSPLNEAFATNLDDLIERHRNIAYWLCGHSHAANRIEIGGTKLILNPQGYPNESTAWDPENVFQW